MENQKLTEEEINDLFTCDMNIFEDIISVVSEDEIIKEKKNDIRRE